MNGHSHLWFYLACGAALCWGLGYTFAERILKVGINPYVFLSIAVASQVIAYPILFFLTDGNLSRQLAVLKNPSSMLYIAAAVVFFIIGNACVFSSVQMKNASLSSLIEITYPIFVVIFSWLLFREAHVNIYTLLGGFLILSGVFLVFLKS